MTRPSKQTRGWRRHRSRIVMWRPDTDPDILFCGKGRRRGRRQRSRNVSVDYCNILDRQNRRRNQTQHCYGHWWWTRRTTTNEMTNNTLTWAVCGWTSLWIVNNPDENAETFTCSQWTSSSIHSKEWGALETKCRSRTHHPYWIHQIGQRDCLECRFVIGDTQGF